MVHETNSGTIELDQWAGIREHFRQTLNQPGATAWWVDAQNLINPEMREYVSTHILEPRSTTT